MATLYRFSIYDDRIDAECHEALPNHPRVAHFIAGALRANDGSVLVARLLCESLLEIGVLQEDSQERVEAFASMHKERGSFSALREWAKTADDAFVNRQIGFMRKLRETMERKNKIVTKPGEHPEPRRYRPALSIKRGKEAHTTFSIIFSAAYAMLSDAPIELARNEAA